LSYSENLSINKEMRLAPPMTTDKEREPLALI
jgi:hypothetical protein